MHAISAGEEHLERTPQWHQSQARLLRGRGRRRKKKKKEKETKRRKQRGD
jgi:hypothetical protein